MKKFRNWVTFAVVLAMVLSLAVGVSASSTSTSAGIYGTLWGWCGQSSSKNFLNTSSSVRQNTDSARFVTTVQFSNSLGLGEPVAESSSRGVTSFTPSFVIYINIETAPSYAYVSHDINSGTQAPSGYSCYTETEINQ